MRYVLLACMLSAPAILFAAEGPVIIAHRGASGYLPEHTLVAYAYAHAEGADFIEPDLVMTKDGVLICLHDIHLEATTDVEERFPERTRRDGRWYAADFTLEEIRSLNAHERLKNRFPADKGRFQVPTFDEMIALVQGLNASTGRTAGIYPELKNPMFHTREGLDMAPVFVETLRAHGYDAPDAPIFIQCFEHRTLQRLREEFGVKAPMIALITNSGLFDAAVTPEGLAAIAEFAQGIGPDKQRIYDDPDLVKRAHALGLAVHPYTLRADHVGKGFDSFAAEVQALFVEHGADGAFTDYPRKTREALEMTARPESP